MSLNLVALLLGLFGVPVALLWLGHRLRKRNPLRSRIFWGGVGGHCVAACLAVTLGMIPPEAWSSGDAARGFAVFWTLLVFPVLGGLLGAAMFPRA